MLFLGIGTSVQQTQMACVYSLVAAADWYTTAASTCKVQWRPEVSAVFYLSDEATAML